MSGSQITAADWVRHGQEVERLCVRLDEVAADQEEMAESFPDDPEFAGIVRGRSLAVREAAFLLRYAAPLSEIQPLNPNSALPEPFRGEP